VEVELCFVFNCWGSITEQWGRGWGLQIIHNNQKGASYCVENVVAVDNQCVQYEYEYNNQPRVTGIDTQSRKNVLLHIGIGYMNV